MVFIIYISRNKQSFYFRIILFVCLYLDIQMSSENLDQIESNLSSINVKRYLDESYDKSVLFKRALSIFRASYFGYISGPIGLIFLCYKHKTLSF